MLIHKIQRKIFKLLPPSKSLLRLQIKRLKGFWCLKRVHEVTKFSPLDFDSKFTCQFIMQYSFRQIKLLYELNVCPSSLCNLLQQCVHLVYRVKMCILFIIMENNENFNHKLQCPREYVVEVCREDITFYSKVSIQRPVLLNDLV